MPFRCLFHVHTRHSYDSLLSPATILQKARLAEIDVLIVTDHETIAGAREIQSLAGGSPRFVITAAEYKTEKGDLIGLFLKQNINARRSEDLIERVHRQGGLVVLPHPYKGHRLDDALLARVDLVEIHNSRCSAAENESAKALATKLALPFLCGADAHCSGELTSAVNDFVGDLPATEPALREAFLLAPRQVKTREVSRIFVPYSQMIKAVKTRNPRLFLRQATHLAATVAHECFQ